MAQHTAQISIRARPSRVWEGLTKPALVKQWQWGSVLETDWRVGRDIRFHSDWFGEVYDMQGKVLEVVPYELIRYSVLESGSGNEGARNNCAIMTYALEDRNDVTILTISLEDNHSRPEDEQAFVANWGTVLTLLKFMIEAP